MELNPYLYTDKVCIKGYTLSDLAGYYCGTYLLRDEDGTLTPHYIEAVTLDEAANKPVAHTTVGKFPLEDLLRFSLPTGFYIVEGRLVKYAYYLNRSYKKGLARDFIKLEPLSDRRPNIFNFLNAALYPKYSNSKGTVKIISPKLAIKDGEIRTVYNSYRVGRVDSVKFGFIKERMGERHA